MTKFGAVWVASLADLVSMKACTYQSRGEKDDLDDMEFALGLMVQRGETFKKFKFKTGEMTIINNVAEACDNIEVKNLLALVAQDM